MEDPVLVAATVVVLSFSLLLGARSILQFHKVKETFVQQGVPIGRDGHWLFGHIFMLLNEDFRAIMQWASLAANEYGQILFWAGPRPLLYVFNLQDAKTVLNKEHERHRPAIVERHVSMMNGKRGLLALNGKDWKLHRAAVTKTFNPNFLSGARKDMMQVTQTMVKSIQKKIQKTGCGSTLKLDVEPLMKMITLDIFGKTALDVDLKSCSGELEASPLANAFEFLIGQMMIRLRNPFKPQHFFYWLPTEQNRRQRRERHLLRSFLADLIAEKRKVQRENPHAAASKDLLSHLLKAHNDVQDMDIVGARQITDDNLTDITMSLFVAGFDTTSITLSCALYLLAQHSQVQENCAKEILHATKEGAMADPDNFTYCKAVILEALRMYPPAVITLRTLSKPMTLSGGLVVPQGTDVTVPIYSIQHDESIFPRHDEFLPDRWVHEKTIDGNNSWVERSEEDGEGDVPAGNRHALLAFSAGGRNCVGMKFAMQEAVLALANLLQGLEFKQVPGFELKTSTKSLLHKPDNGVHLNVSIRSD